MAFWNKDKGSTVYSVTFNLDPVSHENDMRPESKYRTESIAFPNGSHNDNGASLPDTTEMRKLIGKLKGVEWHRITVLGMTK